MCQQIVEWVSDDSNEISTVTETESEPVTCVINRRRYFNVIFSDVVRPIIATKGMSLTKDQLTEGLKQDQTLHTLIADEYNSIKLEYSGNAHPDIEQGPNSDASKFDVITWQKSKRVFGDICNK